MKKILLATIISIFGVAGANAQWEGGAYVGIPVGDSDGYSFNTGGTIAYYFNVVAGLKVGGLTGFDYFFGKNYDFSDHNGTIEVEGDGAGFIPIAAAAKYEFPGKFFVGLDLGYAIGITDRAGDGGFLARPRIGYSVPLVDIYAFYKNIGYDTSVTIYNQTYDGSYNTGSIGLGVIFRF